jgi:hypothetical protein
MKQHITVNSIITVEDAFLYHTNCQLATVDDLAMKKSRSNYEFKRQKLIAKQMCDFIRDHNIEVDAGNRAEDVKLLGWDVEKYSEKYDVKRKVIDTNETK